MEYLKKAEEALIRTLGVPVEAKNTSILGHEIHFVVAGRGSPILLMHGGTFGWGMWYKTIDALSKDHTVYALDLPGTGLSSSLEYNTCDFENDFVGVVEEFIKTHIHDTNLTIVGHSFAGWVAMRLVMRNPNVAKRLVLIDTTGLSDHATVPDLVLSCAPFARFLAKVPLNPKRDNPKLMGFLHSAFAKKNVVLAPEFVDYFYGAMQRSHNLVFISALVRNRKKLHIKELSRTKLPKTLVIWGEKDTIVSAKTHTAFFDGLYNVQVEILPDTGHVPPLESEERTNELLREFHT